MFDIRIVFILVLIVMGIIIFYYTFINFVPGVGKVPNKKQKEYYQSKNKYFSSGKFHNFEDRVKEVYNYKTKNINPNKKIKVDKPKLVHDLNNNDFAFTWLGHSSLFFEFPKLKVLIDPIFSNRASPLSFIGTKRFTDVPSTFEEVDKIDIVLISHDHYDHLDYTTIRSLIPKTKHFIVPLGIESCLLNWKVPKEKIIVLNWWESTKIEDLTIVLTPAKHYSGRNPFRKNITLWGGFLIKINNNNIYYTGDTDYGSHFKKIHDTYGKIDLLLVDTGQYNKKGDNYHMNPHKSIKASNDLEATYQIPVHWGAFKLSNHIWNDPAVSLTELSKNEKVKVIIPRIGETIKYSEIENLQDLWW